MKIGIVCYPVPGGSGAVASELGIGLAGRGHEVHFLSYARPFRLSRYYENLFYHEVEVTNYPLFQHPPYTLTLAAKIASVAEKWKLDIVHAHYAIPHATSAFLAKQILGTALPKVITTLHGTDITLVGLNPSFFDVTRFSIMSSDGITAISNFLARKTKEQFVITKPIEVIPNFVDINRFSPTNPTCKREHFASPNEKIVIHISNFRPVKRIPDVVEVFRRIQAKVPSRLLLIGDGPEAARAQQMVEQYKLEKQVDFLGQQEYVENLLCLGDLFLLPSEQEGFGLAALEAMASGVPVLATRVGGLPEVVIPGESGFLFEVGDVEEMAAKAIEILNDGQGEVLKTKARQVAVERFDWEKILPRYEAYYERILKQ
ncbi:MAG TPA: N-acetyl-alpha-D-glucosaminyl L-malate synthase BshA [candidate division Zixibacteria bacterium]|nr:N-acetyl-alpha-D-glucosaminyl L-malate synthase BshA [candidate division Zixibacteria bacterium]